MGIRELVVIVALLQLGLHYFPWRMLIGKKLPRLAAYTLGLLGMMGPFSAWLIDLGEIEIMQTLWVVIISAGLTVFALYGLDHYLDISARVTESSQREQIMADQIKGKGDGSAN